MRRTTIPKWFGRLLFINTSSLNKLDSWNASNRAFRGGKVSIQKGFENQSRCLQNDLSFKVFLSMQLTNLKDKGNFKNMFHLLRIAFKRFPAMILEYSKRSLSQTHSGQKISQASKTIPYTSYTQTHTTTIHQTQLYHEHLLFFLQRPLWLGRCPPPAVAESIQSHRLLEPPRPFHATHSPKRWTRSPRPWRKADRMVLLMAVGRWITELWSIFVGLYNFEWKVLLCIISNKKMGSHLEERLFLGWKGK